MAILPHLPVYFFLPYLISSNKLTPPVNWYFIDSAVSPGNARVITKSVEKLSFLSWLTVNAGIKAKKIRILLN